jgi:GTP:adenosylcobinamide-phosphate guanylyltransferase
MKAVITAGGRIEGAFAAAAGTGVKALAPIRGTTMLASIVDALRAAGATRIAVVGGDEVRAACAAHVDRVIPASPSGSVNLLSALRAWPEDGQPLLYATSDLPYVTAGAVADFLARAAPGALAVSLTSFAAFAARFPNAPPAFGITLAGERVVNGGIFSIPSGCSERIARVATRFFESRKRPWLMASLVSPLVLIKFCFGRLSIADLESLATATLDVRAIAIRDCAPELAFDVDADAEYEYARAHA